MKPKTPMTILKGLPLFAALALVPAANAANYYYNATDGTPVSGLVGPYGGSGATWNQALPGTVNGLLDSGGGTSTVNLSMVEFNGGTDSWGYSPGDFTIFASSGRGFYNGPGNEQSFTVSNLTVGAVYDVWIASGHLNGVGVGDWSTANTNTTGSSVVIDNTGPDNDNGTSWVAGVNYVLFQNVEVNGSGQITMASHAAQGVGDSRIGLSGFQLVAVVPEPSAALLGGLGLLALLRRRRA